MRALLHLAAQQGLTVHAAHLEEGVLGMYSPDEARIYFDIKLTAFERRSVIAHELGHHHHGHTCDSEANERQADAYAARLLIDPERYAALCRVSMDHEFLAEEFGVTVDVIRSFEQHCLTPMRGVTYVHARLGAAQWRLRRERRAYA
ncbi:ImmA/IrrE family metallo-endopeptidase [Microbacterium sp. BG28]|uniref:ImmA/IrrE family metallo-endopeptidase n=1 Tax=Microbacterium sp. BG28 TaxID=3097356 RepID=UPI002A5AA24F|nr:ImmA/IrrE family metallo-endopeptidase [Microbacterium sp. BG28]MDY0828547.1 ImmA/IrrE family metallo-endopeptidase [Microbacterium sp. BG28]